MQDNKIVAIELSLGGNGVWFIRKNNGNMYDMWQHNHIRKDRIRRVAMSLLEKGWHIELWFPGWSILAPGEE